MRRFTSVLALAAITIVLSSASSWALKRAALVVGNADYPSVGSLRNPLSDADAIAAALKQLGFEVTLKRNIGAQEFRGTLAAFAETSTGAEVSLVYFAGHGVELDGINYLVPTDAKLETKVAARFEAIALDDVREAVSGASKLRVVILDACRNNPFKLAGKDGKRAVTRGLARVEANTNELIAYSAREGTTATDGEGDNSPFALALVRHLAEPGIEVGYLFRKVRGDVVAATNGVQEPFVYATLGEEQLYFNPPAAAAVVPPKVDGDVPVVGDRQAVTIGGDPAAEYGLVKGTTSEKVLLEYIEKHGNVPIWGARAIEDLEALRRAKEKPKTAETEVAIVAPPQVETAPCDLQVLVAGKNDCLKAGAVFRDVDVGPEMVVVPSGYFMMGSVNDADSQPVHEVVIGKPFAIGRYEVTVDQFAAFVAATGYKFGTECWTREFNNELSLAKGREFLNPGYPVTGSHPATCVSYDDAIAYATWLTQTTGRLYRLPSEAEWEYAARAGDAGTYAGAVDETAFCAVANVGDRDAAGSLPNSNIIECNDGHRYSAPVGSFRANPFGLHDILGNVEEWVADCLNSSYADTPKDGSAALTTDLDSCIRVIRGGSWKDGWKGSFYPTDRNNDAGYQRQWSYGFRVVREL